MNPPKPGLVDRLLAQEIVEIGAGKHFCLARTVDGELWVWGRNKDGQLGLGDSSYRDTMRPKKVSFFATGGVKKFSCSEASVVAATDGGAVYQWGAVLKDWKGGGGAKPPANRPLLVFRRDALAGPGKSATRGVERVNVADLRGQLPKLAGDKKQVLQLAELEKIVKECRKDLAGLKRGGSSSTTSSSSAGGAGAGAPVGGAYGDSA